MALPRVRPQASDEEDDVVDRFRVRRRAIFLDRDGVLVKARVIDGIPYPPQTLEEMELIAGVREALDNLRRAGFLLIVVTNQPDVARGKQSRDVIELMHERLSAELPLDEICACFHTDSNHCDCRKPKPGLILDSARNWSISLAESYMVGDRWRDIDAGRAAGCHTIFLDYGYRERLRSAPDLVVSSLLEASRLITTAGA